MHAIKEAEPLFGIKLVLKMHYLLNILRQLKVQWNTHVNFTFRANTKSPVYFFTYHFLHSGSACPVTKFSRLMRQAWKKNTTFLRVLGKIVGHVRLLLWFVLR